MRTTALLAALLLAARLAAAGTPQPGEPQPLEPPRLEPQPLEPRPLEPQPREFRPLEPRPGDLLTLPAGSVLRPLASAVTPPLATLPAAAEVEVVERDGRWLRVRWGETTGWVDPVAAPESGPAPALAPLADELAAARAALGESARAVPIGPFTLLTDVDAPLVDSLDALAAEVAATYAERYALPVPEGEAGIVALFAREADYRAFGRRLGGGSGGDGADGDGAGGDGDAAAEHGFAGQTRGRLAALHVAGRGREQLSRLLVHELVHLLNRQALGEALPPWLDEGLAGDLELFVLTADGRLGAAEPTRRDLEVHGRARPWGPLIALPRLAGDAEVGRLESLAALTAAGQAAFRDPLGGVERYALAAFWVRYLLSGEGGGLAPPFRAWLATRAAGGTAEAAALVARLETATGRDAGRLDAGFRRWLADLAHRLGIEPARR